MIKLQEMLQESTIKVETGKAPTNGIELYYERFGNETAPAIVLIMGLDAQCVLWSNHFIEPLIHAGYQVVRFDNRDIGLSTWIEDWHKSRPYTLEDMALDTIGLLDYLQIKKAHFIGASMGGMIAQRIALSYAERVLSYTGIMSSGHTLDPKAFNLLSRKLLAIAIPKLIKWAPLPIKHINLKVSVSNYLALYKYLSGTKYPFDRAFFTELFTYAIEERKGQNPKARFQQFCAIVASGSRYHELKKMKAKALILHGNADKLVPIAHSRKYASMIPNANFIELEGIGHEIPRAALGEVHSHILTHLRGLE